MFHVSRWASVAGRVISEWLNYQNRRALRETSKIAPVSPVNCTPMFAFRIEDSCYSRQQRRE